MPSSSRRRRRSESLEESDADEVLSQNSDTPRRQRRKLDHDSDVDSSNSPANISAARFNGTTNQVVDMQAFGPGAIVRVKVKNFVTYEEAEFLPGPYLNMVIGPNGTGKSSLVCAICLGLGYSPKHLGRAGAVKEFVKHGKDTALIEIELQKRRQDRRNFVIKLQIRREQNSQKWWLNGKDTTHKSIQDLMKVLKIQVDNLCQFLPQDRVVEFAASTPVDLLRETLRAAAPEELLKWQAKLRDLYKIKKQIAEAVRTDTELLENLETRQQGLQADVDRLRERQEIQQRVDHLKSALVLSQYDDARNRYTLAKDRKKEAERSLRRLEQESGPSLEAINKKELYADRTKIAIGAEEKVLEASQTATRTSVRQVADATEILKEMSHKLDAERNGFEAKKRDVALSRSKITSLQGDLNSRPPDFNASDWTQKIRAEEHHLRDLEAEKRQLVASIAPIKERGRAINIEAAQVEEHLESLNTQEGQQLNFMRRSFPELSTAWAWIQENQGLFEKEVFGPPMISCSIKDERYSNHVQALLQSDDFVCFTTQTRGDYKKLSDQLYRVMSLSAVIRTCPHNLDSFRPPVSTEQRQTLGLDGFAIEYLEGPEPVLAMLCAERRLHLSAVCLNDHSDSQYNQIVESQHISSWVAGKHSYSVRRRKEYGPQAVSTTTKSIFPGRFWTSQPVDSQEKSELSRRLTELRREKDELRVQHEGFKVKHEAIENQKSEIAGKIDKLKSEKNTLQKEFQKWQALPMKIESEERQKAAHELALREARKRMADILYEWDEAALERSKKVLLHKDSIDKIRQVHQALLKAKICLIEAQSDVEGLKQRNASIMEQVNLQKQAVQEASDEANTSRELGRRLGEEVREILVGNESLKDHLTQLAEGKTPTDITLEIGAEEAQLELIHAANPSVIRDFERRGQEIDRLKKKIEDVNHHLGQLNGELNDLMGKWEPKVDELVSKINDAFAYNFEQISCAGEVRVNKVEDFEQWSLDIMVRFRENETLQQLTAHRQSGGERAVSTIFYLMALQSLAQSPFRVVDEINQGMDPRNERMVHERMVEIACREHTSQYFLITPKLLTGLRYDEKMRVLCIASGEHMPGDGGKLDFRRCLNLQRRLAAAA